MANYQVVTETRRYLNLVRRVIEVIGVLFLAFLTTILTLCFGWIAVLFKPSSTAGHALSNAAGPSPVNTSDKY
jgi:hypothetical protein